MIIVLSVLLISGLLTAIIIYRIKDKCKCVLKREYGPYNDLHICGEVVGLVMVISITAIILIVSFANSYCTHLEALTINRAIYTNYKNAIKMYENKAIIDVSDLTDFKYNGYQNNLSNLIKDLRHKIERYNEIIIIKRAKKKVIFFNWLIVGPDPEMKLLGLKE